MAIVVVFLRKKMRRLLYLLVVQFCCIAFISAQWTTGSDIPQKIRAGNTESHSINGKTYAYLFGGRNDQEIISNKTYRYSLSDDTWDTMANVPTPILGSSSARLGDNIYIIGGLVTTPGTVTKKVYKYSIPTNLWSQVADTPSPYTDGDAVAYQDSLIYTVGSYNGEKSFVYNVNTNKWRTATSVPSPGFALAYGAVSVVGNKLFYVGGSNGTFSPTFWNNLWIGEIDQNNRAVINWTAGAAFPGETRTFFEMKPWKDGLILIGGTTDNTFNTVSNENYFYNPQLNTWTELPPKPAAWNTGNATSALVDGVWKLFCTGGYNTEYLDTTEIFSQASLATADSNLNQCHIKNMVATSGKNPKISFCTKEIGVVKIGVIDAKGALLKEILVRKNSGKEVISLEELHLPGGIYFITISQNGGGYSKKIQIF